MKILLYSILLLLVLSCQRHNGGYMSSYNWDSDAYPLADFVPLKVGNYWVYQVFEMDTMGNDSLIGVDTLMITDDTIIQGRQWFLLYENHGFGSETPYSKYVSDSSGYLIYENGQIGFSTVNFTETLRKIVDEGISVAEYRMLKDPEDVEVPAGTFRCLNYRATVTVDKSLIFWKHPGNYCNYYAPGVGKVKSTAFYISKPKRLERRLMKYHIE